MDDDVEVEDFEITDRDLMEGFGLGFRRHRMTKEEAIYGMWAERDSDDDEGPRGYSKKRKKDYTKPLNFVSGGIVQKGKDKNLDDDGTNLVTVFLLYTYNKKYCYNYLGKISVQPYTFIMHATISQIVLKHEYSHVTMGLYMATLPLSLPTKTDTTITT